MGILDYVPLKEIPKIKQYDDTPGILTCDVCGDKFTGHKWMLKSKKEITCPRCYRYQKLDEEEFDDIF